MLPFVTNIRFAQQLLEISFQLLSFPTLVMRGGDCAEAQLLGQLESFCKSKKEPFSYSYFLNIRHSNFNFILIHNRDEISLLGFSLSSLSTL